MIGCRYLDTDASTALAPHQSKHQLDETLSKIRQAPTPRGATRRSAHDSAPLACERLSRNAAPLWRLRALMRYCAGCALKWRRARSSPPSRHAIQAARTRYQFGLDRLFVRQRMPLDNLWSVWVRKHVNLTGLGVGPLDDLESSYYGLKPFQHRGEPSSEREARERG
eukprot:5584777-Prymnesium_polylepis.1